MQSTRLKMAQKKTSNDYGKTDVYSWAMPNSVDCIKFHKEIYITFLS